MKNVISVTSRALNQLLKIKTEYNSKYIHFGVKSGGCSGFQYVLEPCNKELESYQEVYIKDNVKIKICNFSLMNILGTEIDWQENIMGKQFIFNNPNANVKCGCGSSFG